MGDHKDRPYGQMNCATINFHQTPIVEALKINGFSVDAEIINKFNILIEMVLKWSQTINITAHREPTDIIDKDILDNLFLEKFINRIVSVRRGEYKIRLYNGCDGRRGDPCDRPQQGSGRTQGLPLRGIDMGSGAGFSGLVLMIVNPSLQMTFLDSDRKKINFTREVCRQIGLKQATFIHSRAELYPKLYKEAFNYSVTRATWPLEEYLRHVHYYVQNSGYAFFMLGKGTKNPSWQILKGQGFAGNKEFFYKIEPKGYERSILTFKKIDF